MLLATTDFVDLFQSIPQKTGLTKINGNGICLIYWQASKQSWKQLLGQTIDPLILKGMKTVMKTKLKHLDFLTLVYKTFLGKARNEF